MIAAHTEVSAFPDPQAWLAAIVESSDDAIIGKRLDGTIVSWNEASTRTFGYTADEIIGRSVLTLFPPELRHEEVGIVAKLSRGERVEHYETVRMHKDGTRINVSLSVSPIRDEYGVVVGAAKIVRNITQQKEIERRMAELNESLTSQVALARAAQDQAEAASRAKSQFLATMSHELRTPLNAIGGYADLIDAGVQGEIPERYRDYLDRIRSNQLHLLELITALLDLSKIESGQMELHIAPVSVADLFARVEAMTAPQAIAKKHSINMDCADKRLKVLADPDRAVQILLNLLSNAIKFTPPGGKLTCRVGRAGGKISMRIIDSGPGIEPREYERVFEPFVQLERTLSSGHEGAGLGLAISRDLVRAMGGDIGIEETKGGGATFIVSLPAAD